MRKNIVKVLSGLLILGNLLTISASANEYIWLADTIFYSNPQMVYANSSQWDKRYDSLNKNYYWVCATPDFQQGYCNAWIYTDGKWYYVDSLGRMQKDTLVGDKSQKERYLLGEDGSMETNTYWNQFGSSNYIDSNGLVHLPDTYYNMMPPIDGQSNLVAVPNLVGLDIDAACYALNSNNLYLSRVDKETSNQAENNKILNQSIQDAKVEQGTTITVTVGKYVITQNNTNKVTTTSSTGVIPTTGTTRN